MKSYVLVLMCILVLVLFGAFVVANNFGFEKNVEHRKNADTEGVLGCMTSCQEMLAGWLEMNPDSNNYARQQEKIAAKAEQCLAMNELAGFPIYEEEILFSCGLKSECYEIPPEISIDEGACLDISSIDEIGIPQCCTTETPRGIDCGVEQEWVVGVAAFPVCYISGS